MIDALRRGQSLYNAGRFAEAEQLCDALRAEHPDDIRLLHLLGRIRFRQRNYADALACIEPVLRLNPDLPGVLADHGRFLLALGRRNEALASLDKALAIRPDYVQALQDRARALAGLKRREEALAACDRLLALRPDTIGVLMLRGDILAALGRHAEALPVFDRVLALDDRRIDALSGRAVALMALDRHREAIETHDRILALEPNHFAATINRCVPYLHLDRIDDALAVCEKALAAYPNTAEAWANRARILARMERFEEAFESYDRALELSPANANIITNRGWLLQSLGRLQEARADYDRALAIAPAFTRALFNDATARLLLGDFHEGWKRYEARWGRKGVRRRRPTSTPLWLGDAPLAGKTILLQFEQGYGDTIQFARYAPLVERLGARVLLEVQAPLKELLAPLAPGAIFAGTDTLPPFDFHCPLLSLPLAFDTDLATIPAEVPYIGAPLYRVVQWRDRLPAAKFRIGVAWAGSPTHANDRNRSISLTDLAPLFDLPDVAFIGLQKDLRQQDQEFLTGNPRLRHVGDDLRDFTDTAAVIAQLDLVVTVDTSVVHLAGAMAKPVWLLLPSVGDFRWMLDREDSPWYPTARLFRQSKRGDWASVIARVREAAARASRDKIAG